MEKRKQATQGEAQWEAAEGRGRGNLYREELERESHPKGLGNGVGNLGEEKGLAEPHAEKKELTERGKTKRQRGKETHERGDKNPSIHVFFIHFPVL